MFTSDLDDTKINRNESPPYISLNKLHTTYIHQVQFTSLSSALHLTYYWYPCASPNSHKFKTSHMGKKNNVIKYEAKPVQVRHCPKEFYWWWIVMAGKLLCEFILQQGTRIFHRGNKVLNGIVSSAKIKVRCVCWLRKMPTSTIQAQGGYWNKRNRQSIRWGKCIDKFIAQGIAYHLLWHNYYISASQNKMRSKSAT